ncbi:MAG TPA: two-component system response regulator [Prolixibacteraceae bacterium]|nr:MAG: two-component system response regulator [Bacteroidetes bacterium GWB2_41_8]HCY43500.1 two-component system response regulator [Prolixibacteraceae bacterium]
MNTKLKCLLLDDELPGLSYLKLLCEQIPELEVVRAFNDPETFLREFAGLEFDLCILDIEMPGTSGIELAALLKNKPVIFTTAYKDYATDAFDLDAIDYVIKPIKPERIQQAVNKAIHRIHPKIREKKHLRLNTDKGIALLDPAQLVYVRTSEIDPRDKTANLANGTIIHLKNISFEKLISLLPSGKFCRVNKKELISMSAVQHFSNDQITTNICFQSEKPLIISLGETYRANFISQTKG